MFCPRCGTPRMHNEKFCSRCHQQMSTASPTGVFVGIVLVGLVVVFILHFILVLTGG